MRVGVISDTHGLVRPEALDALQGSDLILHAGDIGKSGVIPVLSEVAPVVAVRGNVDQGDWADRYPAYQSLDIMDHQFYMLHNIAELGSSTTHQTSAVVFGHSHKPLQEWRDGVLYFNPGSAGPRRFKLPICVGMIEIDESGLQPEIIDLKIN